MSYDLNFWRQDTSVTRVPAETYADLCEEVPVQGLATLPIDKYLQRIKDTFPGCAASQTTVNWEGEEGAFQVSWSEQHVRIDCYNLNPDAMNRLIDIGLEFDCPLYDPQVDQRYSDSRHAPSSTGHGTRT